MSKRMVITLVVVLVAAVAAIGAIVTSGNDPVWIGSQGQLTVERTYASIHPDGLTLKIDGCEIGFVTDGTEIEILNRDEISSEILREFDGAKFHVTALGNIQLTKVSGFPDTRSFRIEKLQLLRIHG